jgi:pyruvate formate lyase activating enzyme
MQTDKKRTSLDVLTRAHAIGKAAGLRYVFLGNVRTPGKPYASTLCPSCDEMLVSREGYATRIKVCV